MPTIATLVEFNTVSDYVYRCCWMTEELRVTGQISAGQATAVLAAWNGAIKAPAGLIQASLPAAANLTKENLAFWFNTGPLKSQVQLFATQVLAVFPEQQVAAHPCSNWATLILSFASTMA